MFFLAGIWLIGISVYVYDMTRSSGAYSLSDASTNRRKLKVGPWLTPPCQSILDSNGAVLSVLDKT